MHKRSQTVHDEFTHNPNRSLIRIFCLSLSGLLAVYAILGVTNLFQLESGDAAGQAAGVFRSALALVAVELLHPLELARRGAGVPCSP